MKIAYASHTKHKRYKVITINNVFLTIAMRFSQFKWTSVKTESERLLYGVYFSFNLKRYIKRALLCKTIGFSLSLSLYRIDKVPTNVLDIELKVTTFDGRSESVF